MKCTRYGFRFRCACAAAAALVLATSGCLFIPVLGPNNHSDNARTNVDEEITRHFQPGQCTRAEVILQLGEPDAVSLNERQLTYRSEKVVGYWILIGGGAPDPGGGASADTFYREKFFTFEFDPPGRLQCARTSKQWTLAQGAKTPELPSTLYTFLRSTNRSVVGVERIARWLPDVNGFRGWKGQLSIGKLGQFLLTESNLIFAAKTQVAHPQPELDWPLTSITNVFVARSSFVRRLVLQTERANSTPSTFSKRTVGKINRP